MKKLALHWKIIIGMVFGVFYGLLASKMGWLDLTNDWIKPYHNDNDRDHNEKNKDNIIMSNPARRSTRTTGHLYLG